jgi:hypothetical protein
MITSDIGSVYKLTPPKELWKTPFPSHHNIKKPTKTVLGGNLVTTACCILRKRIEGWPPVIEGRCDALNKKPQTEDKG